MSHLTSRPPVPMPTRTTPAGRHAIMARSRARTAAVALGATLAGVALVGCSATGPGGATAGSPTALATSGLTDEQRAATQTLVGEFVEAFNDGDARALAATFADDAEFVNIYGTRMSGREGIERGHAAAFASRLDGSELVVDLAHVADVDGALVVQAEWSLQHSPGAVDDALLVPEGSGVLTFSATCRPDDSCLFASGANVRVETPPS